MAVLLSFPLTALSQDSLRAGSYFRVDSENDIYQRYRDITDRYFTNGLRLTLLSNYWQRWPTRHLLPTFHQRPGRRYDLLYYFTIGQDIYTPRDILKPRFTSAPAYYDHPYAGYLFAAWGLTVSDAAGSRKLTTNLSLGVLGPLSLAAEGQMGLHHLIHNPQPIGWDKQLRTDPMLNYYVRYEGRPIGRFVRELDLVGGAEANAGTLTNYLGTSLMLRFGRFNDYFQNATSLYDRNAPHQRPLQFYTFIRPTLRAVLDNSTLQGGWLNRRGEPYALPFSQIRHGYAQLEYGGVVAYKGFQFAYSVVRRGREYDSGERHQWGRIVVAWR